MYNLYNKLYKLMLTFVKSVSCYTCNNYPCNSPLICFMNTTANEIEHIKEILPSLSETALHELRAFTDYLADRERRRKALVEQVLKAEREPDSVICNSVKEAMQAILNTPDVTLSEAL